MGRRAKRGWWWHNITPGSVSGKKKKKKSQDFLPVWLKREGDRPGSGRPIPPLAGAVFLCWGQSGRAGEGGEERSDAFCGSGKFSAIKLDPWKKINMFENPAPMLKLQ